MDWEEMAQLIIAGLCGIIALPLFIFALFGSIASVQILGIKFDVYEAQKRLEIAKIEAQMPAKKECGK